MIRLKVSISSAQKEMENKRQAIRAHLWDGDLLRRFSDVFLFGDLSAVAHRDYTSNVSVQAMFFSDRLDVWNPGTLPPALTLEKLRKPHGSVPGNPLLAGGLIEMTILDNPRSNLQKYRLTDRGRAWLGGERS
jgi:hypothetical protein